MANKVSSNPIVSFPIALTSISAIADFLVNFVASIIVELREHALRLNNAMVMDGTEVPSAPVRLNSYLKAALPSASTYTAGLIYVTNDVGGAVPAFSDGTNWRRVTDRNVIS